MKVKKCKKKRYITWGFANKEPIDDFLITPCLAYGYTKTDNARIDAIGVKFGFWGIFIALASYDQDYYEDLINEN